MDVPNKDVPAVQHSNAVRDRGSYVRECVRRTLLRTALGESYAYEVIPVLAPAGTGGVEAGYVVYISIPLPVPIGSRVAVGSKPFEFDAGDDMIERVTLAVVEMLGKARAEALRMP
jgi:hypothetical protein